MDFQKIVDGISAMACIVSVELKEDGGYGDLRIVAGNQKYVGSIEHPIDKMHLQKKTFVANKPYTDYVPRDLNFEQYCHQAVIGKRCLHSYSRSENFGLWFNMTYIPLATEEEGIGYCVFITEMGMVADTSRMTEISGDLARLVLEICLKIRGTTDFRAAMNEVMRDLLDLCEARRCCIILMDQEARTCDVLCEATAKDWDLPPVADVITPKFYELVETWEATLAGSSGLIVSNEQDMDVLKERNPKWHRSLMRGGVDSVILYPIKSQNELLGFIWVTNFDTEKAPDIKETLELATFILGSEVANYQLLERLRILSTRDLLTGVQNRNQMNHYVDQLSKGKEGAGKSVGVIFADVNDLKTVNDFNGHDAGDELLKAAADVLMNVFPEEAIFRAGGDEFTVMLQDITQQELETLIKKMQDVSSERGKVSFAIGADFEEDAKNVRVALRNADEKMYEDKRLFYEQHPEKQRTPGLV